jgi:hypothetical protein
MKLKCFKLQVAFLLVACSIQGQGFVYDQQSTNLIEGSSSLRSGQPMGQSFTPTLSSVSFILLNLYDSDALHNSGATVFVNLRSNSVTGPILGSSAGVFLPDQFFGTTNFFFTTPINVASGTTYYFQPVIQSGDSVGSYVTDTSYAGTAYALGAPVFNHELWFREGILAVPEPSPVWLAWLGGAVWLFARRQFFR